MGTGMTDGELSQWIDAHMVQLGQSGIRISDGSVIYIDAFRKTEGVPRADFIFVTHEHGDHFNPGVIQALRGPHTHVVVPESMRETGKDGGLSTAGIRPGETATIGSLVVKAFPAHNLKKPMHARHKDHVCDQRQLLFLLATIRIPVSEGRFLAFLGIDLNVDDLVELIILVHVYSLCALHCCSLYAAGTARVAVPSIRRGRSRCYRWSFGGQGSWPGATVSFSRMRPSIPWMLSSPPPLLRRFCRAASIASFCVG